MGRTYIENKSFDLMDSCISQQNGPFQFRRTSFSAFPFKNTEVSVLRYHILCPSAAFTTNIWKQSLMKHAKTISDETFAHLLTIVGKFSLFFQVWGGTTPRIVSLRQNMSKCYFDRSLSPLHEAQKRSCYRFVSLTNGIMFSTY